jgi:phospholipid/cholesterol/gamma-HCH transport system substrate-binding protein
METRANYVMVGAFVVLCVVGLFGALVWVAGSQYRTEYAYYQTYFNAPVTGLDKGTIVRYNGIEAGRITDLTFDAADPKRVIVIMQVDPRLHLHADSLATIESQGLTGATYLEITGGTAASPFLKRERGQRYPVVASKSATGLEQLEQSGNKLVTNLNVAGERFNDLLNDQNRKAIADTLEHLRTTTAVLSNHAEDLDQTLENARAATESLNHTLHTADHALDSADHALSAIDHAADSFGTASKSADATVQKVGRLSDDADKVVNGQAVTQLAELMAQARALVTSMTRLSDDLERQPTKLLFGDQRKGYTPQ